MPSDLRAAVELARLPTLWDVGNEVLYELCTKHPRHAEIPAVIAKVWLIGRSYAAAIERRRNKADERMTISTFKLWDLQSSVRESTHGLRPLGSTSGQAQSPSKHC